MQKMAVGITMVALVAACSDAEPPTATQPGPVAVIDLGTLITEDVAERWWGKAMLRASNLDRPNEFERVEWSFESGGGKATGSNGFYTLANHGGPHIDAPNHMNLGAGLDGWPVNVYTGSLRVIDVSGYPSGRSVPAETFDAVRAGEVVLIHRGYTAPANDTEMPETITLAHAAAEYLANLPVKAFGTDSFSVANFSRAAPVESDDPVVRATPIHHAFLSRGIPIYEQLANVDQLLDKENMYFVGAPLNIRDGDGMLVRPVVLVY